MKCHINFVKDNYLLHLSVNTPIPQKTKTKQKNAKNKSNKKKPTQNLDKIISELIQYIDS
jgi:hypothetical protein